MAALKNLTAANLFNVKGWVSIVTGGGTGIGLMTAKVLAANGSKVYVTGRRAEKLREAELQDESSGGSITGLQMDVLSKDSIADVVKQISAKEKFVNLLVNNAGISSKNYGPGGIPHGTPEQVSKAMFERFEFGDWTTVYNTNVSAIFFVSAAFIPLLCAARDHGFPEAGNILNISSLSGITKGSQNGQYSYNAAKAGTISLTHQLALDLKPPNVGIRVNTLAPGYFPSEMSHTDGDLGKDPEHFRKHWGTPIGRVGNITDYSQAVLGLVCNQFVTGATHLIDGGYLLQQP